MYRIPRDSEDKGYGENPGNGKREKTGKKYYRELRNNNSNNSSNSRIGVK